MRRRYRFDPDLDCLVEIGGNANYFEERPQTAAVISDDVGVGVNGLRHMPSGKMLDSKSAHRKETRARGLEEVGNDRMASKRDAVSRGQYETEVRAAQEQIHGNWNGTADWLRRQNEQKPR